MSSVVKSIKHSVFDLSNHLIVYCLLLLLMFSVRGKRDSRRYMMISGMMRIRNPYIEISCLLFPYNTCVLMSSMAKCHLFAVHGTEVSLERGYSAGSIHWDVLLLAAC